MKKAVLISLAGVLACGALATADYINFEGAYAANGNGSDPNLFYSNPTFTGNYFGVVGGLGNGDPGNWGLMGTNGSAFWGFNVNVTGGMLFGTDVIDFSMDISRSNGSSTGQTLLIDFYNNSVLVGSDFIVLGTINSWTTIIFNGILFDEVQFAGSQNGFSPYGIDNIQFTIPAPGALCLLAMGGLIGIRRRR